MTYCIAMKKLKNTNERNIKNWSIKSKSGEVITDRDKVILRWHEFYSTLCYSNCQVFTSYKESSPILPTTSSEIENALKKLNKGNSSGPNNITSEFLIAGGPVLQTWLKFLNRVIPDELNVYEIFTLFKKGDPLDCGNYRPMSLLSHVYKSSNVNEVIGAVRNSLFFFFYEKILHAPKSSKSTKSIKSTKSTKSIKSTKTQPSKSTKRK